MHLSWSVCLFMLHFSVADWDVMESYGVHVYVCSRLITRGLFMLHFTVADGVVWCACVCVFTPHHTCYLTWTNHYCSSETVFGPSKLATPQGMVFIQSYQVRNLCTAIELATHCTGMGMHSHTCVCVCVCVCIGNHHSWSRAVEERRAMLYWVIWCACIVQGIEYHLIEMDMDMCNCVYQKSELGHCR